MIPQSESPDASAYTRNRKNRKFNPDFLVAFESNGNQLYFIRLDNQEFLFNKMRLTDSFSVSDSNDSNDRWSGGRINQLMQFIDNPDKLVPKFKPKQFKKQSLSINGNRIKLIKDPTLDNSPFRKHKAKDFTFTQNDIKESYNKIAMY